MACESIKAKLDDAIAARQRLITGAQVVIIVDAFRSRVEYAKADLPSLTAEIQRLQAEYNTCLAAGGAVTPLTKPMRFFF